jgi:hypothetical protein
LTALGHKAIHVLDVDLLEASDSKRQDLVPGSARLGVTSSHWPLRLFLL